MRVSIMLNGSVVDGQEAERFQVIHPHRVRILLEEKAIAFVGAGYVWFAHDPS